VTAKGPGLWWFGLFAEKDGLAEEFMAGRELQWVTGFIPTFEVVKGALTACDLDIYAHFLAQYATNVTGVVIPNSGHWLYEEHPAELTRILLQFLG